MPDTASPLFAAATGVVVGLLLWGQATRKPLAHAVTLAHELGHAAVGLLVGGRVRRVSIALDASGETLTLIGGRAPHFRLALFTLAGYPAPGLVGLAAAAAVAGEDHRLFLLLAALLVGAALLLWVRNLWGLAVFAVTVATLWLAATQGNDDITRSACIALAWLFTLGGCRSAWALARHRTSTTTGLDDAARVSQLARFLPTQLVAAGFVAVSASCLLGAAALLLRPAAA